MDIELILAFIIIFFLVSPYFYNGNPGTASGISPMAASGFAGASTAAVSDVPDKVDTAAPGNPVAADGTDGSRASMAIAEDIADTRESFRIPGTTIGIQDGSEARSAASAAPGEPVKVPEPQAAAMVPQAGSPDRASADTFMADDKWQYILSEENRLVFQADEPAKIPDVPETPPPVTTIIEPKDIAPDQAGDTLPEPSASLVINGMDVPHSGSPANPAKIPAVPESPPSSEAIAEQQDIVADQADDAPPDLSPQHISPDEEPLAPQDSDREVDGETGSAARSEKTTVTEYSDEIKAQAYSLTRSLGRDASDQGKFSRARDFISAKLIRTFFKEKLVYDRGLKAYVLPGDTNRLFVPDIVMKGLRHGTFIHTGTIMSRYDYQFYHRLLEEISETPDLTPLKANDILFHMPDLTPRRT